MSFLKGIYRGKTYSLSASEMTCVAVSMAWCVAGQGVVCNTMTLVNFHRSLRVMRIWCWCMMYNGLCHLAVSIEADITMVVSTLVSYEHCWTVIVEMPSVVVRVHCKRPAAGLPCYRTIEVGESHILVILPAVQDIAEISVTAVPPDAEDITISIQAHQVVEIDLIDSLILCSGEVELVSHLVREEEGFVLCCVIAHCVGSEIVMTIIIARIIIFFISLSPIL